MGASYCSPLLPDAFAKMFIVKEIFLILSNGLGSGLVADENAGDDPEIPFCDTTRSGVVQIAFTQSPLRQETKAR
jgi:hypothetical protein